MAVVLLPFSFLLSSKLFLLVLEFAYFLLVEVLSLLKQQVVFVVGVLTLLVNPVYDLLQRGCALLQLGETSELFSHEEHLFSFLATLLRILHTVVRNLAEPEQVLQFLPENLAELLRVQVDVERRFAGLNERLLAGRVLLVLVGVEVVACGLEHLANAFLDVDEFLEVEVDFALFFLVVAAEHVGVVAGEGDLLFLLLHLRLQLEFFEFALVFDDLLP